MAALRQFAKSIDGEQLASVLNGAELATEALLGSPSLDPLLSAVANLNPDTPSDEIDRELVEPVHSALKISKRQGGDPRLWQWLCSTQCSELVWRRWVGEVPKPSELGVALTPSRIGRFLCRPTLNGTARNTLARLWWAAETLDGDYDLARQALSNQDMFVAIFEREFGTYSPAVRACLSSFEGRNSSDIRDASKWLQQCLSTTVLEQLDEDAISAILAERLG